MSRPTADSTAAANSWLRSQRDLRAVLDEALDDLDIAEALERQRIPRAEARAVVLEDPNVLAALRTHRDWWKPLLERSDAEPRIGLRSRRLAGVRPVVRIVVAFMAVIGYFTLGVLTNDATPWPVDLFTFVGLFATVGFAVGLAGEDVWRVIASNRWNWWAWRPYALDEVILPRVFQFLDERRAPDYGTTLALDGVHNLYQDERDGPVVITSAGQRLRRIMDGPRRTPWPSPGTEESARRRPSAPPRPACSVIPARRRRCGSWSRRRPGTRPGTSCCTCTRRSPRR